MRSTGDSIGTVFANPALRRINLAYAGSAIGDWAYATAMVVWAYGVGGVAAVGIWGTIRLTVMTIASPFGGALADRFPRQRVMITTDLTRAILVTTTAAMVLIHAHPILVFVPATLTALTASPFRAAVAALLPSLVDRPEELTAANGTTSTIESLSFFVGPAIGGLLLTVANVQTVILFDALSFIWSAYLVSRVKSRPAANTAEPEATGEPHDPEGPTRPAHNALTAGFRAIWANSDLRLITAVYCAQTIVAGASIAFAVEVAVQMTTFGPKGVGYLDSGMGVGAIIGGLLAIGRAGARRNATDFGAGVILWALPLLLITLRPDAISAFIAFAVIGFANPIVDVNAATIVQRLSRDELLGRVFGALESGLIAAMALGSIIMPLLIAMIGLRSSLAVLAGGVTVMVIPLLPRLRRLNLRLAPPEGLELLKELALFAPLRLRDLEDVAGRLVRHEFRTGEVIIREGDIGDRFYVIESGGCRATFRGTELSTQGPGDPFGEIALLRDIPRTATVTATEPTITLSLDRADFLAAVTGNRSVSDQFEDLIAGRTPTY